MTRTNRFLATFVAAAVVPAALLAADLPTGEWTGTVTPPEGTATPATFTVGQADGQTAISVSVMGLNLEFREIEITDDGLAFTWTPGPDVRCQLELQDDSTYSGPCTDTEGGTGHITMVPPG